jgi:hypothetical protein
LVIYMLNAPMAFNLPTSYPLELHPEALSFTNANLVGLCT